MRPLQFGSFPHQCLPTMHCKTHVALCQGSTAIGWTVIFEQDCKAGSGYKPMKGGRGKEYKNTKKLFHQHCHYRGTGSRQLNANGTGLMTTDRTPNARDQVSTENSLVQ